MDPITTPGAANYTMTVPQTTNNQIQEYPDYSNMPMVYEPEVEQKKNASSNMLGMTALGILAIAGLGFGYTRGKKVSGLKQEIAQLSAEKDAALKAKDEAVKIKEEVTQALDKERTLTCWQRFARLFYPNYGLTKEEKEARAVANEAKKAAEKAAKAEKKEVKKAAKAEKKAEKESKKTDSENK